MVGGGVPTFPGLDGGGTHSQVWTGGGYLLRSGWGGGYLPLLGVGTPHLG